jgi:hypothetical protein
VVRQVLSFGSIEAAIAAKRLSFETYSIRWLLKNFASKEQLISYGPDRPQSSSNANPTQEKRIPTHTVPESEEPIEGLQANLKYQLGHVSSGCVL